MREESSLKFIHNGFSLPDPHDVLSGETRGTSLDLSDIVRSDDFPGGSYDVTDIYSDSETEIYSDHSSNILSFLSINVGGLNNKIHSPDFENFINKYDFICSQETHFDAYDSINMEGFTCFPPMVRTRAKYKSGGIAILVNNRIYDTVNNVKNSGEIFYCFTCSLCSDVLFCATYIPPEGCTYSNISIFDDLEHDLLELYQNKSLICLLRDFKARTGNVQDFVTYDKNFDQFLNGDSPNYELNSVSICD